MSEKSVPPCPHCGSSGNNLRYGYPYANFVTVYCDNCYDADFDGENFVSKNIMGMSTSKEKALNDYIEQIEDFDA